VLPDDRLRAELQAEEDRTHADPAFLDALYGRLEQERRRRSSPSARFVARWRPVLTTAGAFAAVLVAVAVAFSVLRAPEGPAATPSPTVAASASPEASRSAVPVPSIRSLGIAFEEIPDWIVPADASGGPASSSEDGTWSQTFTIPRAPEIVEADFESRLANQAVRFEAANDAPDQLTVRSRGVAPSIVVTITTDGEGSLVSVAFDRRGTP
jgi:hypothetical protein